MEQARRPSTKERTEVSSGCKEGAGLAHASGESPHRNDAITAEKAAVGRGISHAKVRNDEAHLGEPGGTSDQDCRDEGGVGRSTN